jgi:hypothetical protein
MAIQRYGLGRSGALMVGDLFRLGIGHPELVADLAKFWRQVARWLVTDTPNQVELSAQTAGAGKPARLLGRVRDDQARPVEDAEVEVRIKRVGDSDASAVVVRAEPASEAGLYALDYHGTSPGALIAEAFAKNTAGALIGRSPTGWVEDSTETEFAAVTPDRKAMEELAVRTGGTVLTLEDLDSLVSRLQHSANIAMEERVSPLWHTGTVFVLALGCFVFEWILRRRHGAA